MKRKYKVENSNNQQPTLLFRKLYFYYLANSQKLMIKNQHLDTILLRYTSQI